MWAAAATREVPPLPKLWFGFFLAALAIGIIVGQALVIAFGVMGLLAGGISWAWNRLALEEVYYEREFGLGRFFVGEEMPLTVSLVNRKVVPLTWARVQDEVPEALNVVAGDVKSNVQPKGRTLNHSTSMAWYERVRWNYRVKCMQRGLYRLGPALIESGDPFGFLGVNKREPKLDDVLVYPRVVSLDELGIPPIRPLGEAREGIKIFPDPSRPSGLREYELGDPLKTVDWKATARTQQLQVRTFEPSSSTTIIIVVAVDTTTPFWGSYPAAELERVITVSASVTAYASEREYSIGLFSNDMPIRADKPMNVAPGRGPEQLSLMLGALAIIRPYALAPMASQLAEHARRFPIGATLVVSSAYLPPDFVRILQDLKRRGHKIVVLYVGEEPCPDLGDGVVVHQLRDRLDKMEAVGDLISAAK